MRSWVATLTQWTRSPYAIWILGGLSFIESIFFPIPPDVMLLPMMIVYPQRAWVFAGITVLGSLIGAFVAYQLGYFFSPTISAYLINLGFEQAFTQAKQWFDAWGAAAVIVAGFTPIPFKVFTLTAGILQMNLTVFLIASTIGRSLRFGVEAILVKSFGYLHPDQIKQVMIALSWSMILLFALFLGYTIFGYG